MTYADWVSYHSRLFGLLSPDELAMVSEWARHFAQGGFAPDEMAEASQDIARTAPPRFRSEHLPALQRTLDRLRQRCDSSEPPQGPRCDLCGDCGRVSVPNPKSLRGGPWTTVAVTCHCPLGRWWHAQLSSRRAPSPDRPAPRPTSLEEYEQIVPDWRELVAARDKARARELDLKSRATSLDELLGELARKVTRWQHER